MSQPVRFAIRSRILRDKKLSHGAKVLYLLLDDEARGEPLVALTQQYLAAQIGVKERACREMIAELQRERYLNVQQTRGAAMYDFVRQKIAGVECEDRQKTAAQTGRKLPVYLITQEPQEPPTPFEPSQSTDCRYCGGRGIVMVVVRGQGTQRRCQCREERRSA